MEFHAPPSACSQPVYDAFPDAFRPTFPQQILCRRRSASRRGRQPVGSKLTSPSMLPSESVTKACHSVVPAGPRLSSSWVKIA